MTYRPDIDGLRAIAILSVIVYHAWPFALPGGFVGVDIFFVISGYLISKQIFSEIQSGTFSVTEFYRRRIKRIAPAMLLVIFVTVIVSELILLPFDSQDVARSGLASLLSVANVYFWFFEDTSYFASATDELPLLHLWSLGIEEQFYLLWPLILLGVGRSHNRPSFVASVVVLIALSILFGQYYYSIDPSFVFYMLPARAGELLFGAAIALVVLYRKLTSMRPEHFSILAWTGLSLVIGSVFLTSPDAVFPGFQSVPPTLGTGLLILAGHFHTTSPTQLISKQPFVNVGLVSYSAYLWHWPILAFLNYGRFEVDFVVGLGVISLTFLLAVATYRYIETPLRRSQRPFAAVLTGQYLAPVVVLLPVLAAIELSNGLAFRWHVDNYSTQLQQVRNETKSATQYDYVCQSQSLDIADFSDGNCTIGKLNKTDPTVILFGDSNAAQYVGILGEFANSNGFAFRNVEIGSCPPIRYGLAQATLPKRLHDCQSSLALAWPEIQKYEIVAIGASWTTYAQRSSTFVDDLLLTITDLTRSGRQILILGKTPVINGFDLQCRQKAVGFPLKRCVHEENVPLHDDITRLNARLRSFADVTDNVEYFDPNELLCPEGYCPVFWDDGSPRYFDANHITMDTSWRLGKLLDNEEMTPSVFLNFRPQSEQN